MPPQSLELMSGSARKGSAVAPKGPGEEAPHALEEQSHALEEAPQEHE